MEAKTMGNNGFSSMQLTALPQNTDISYQPLIARVDGVYEMKLRVAGLCFYYPNEKPNLGIWWNSKKSSLYIVNPKLNNGSNQSSESKECELVELESTDQIKYEVDLAPLSTDIEQVIFVYERSSVSLKVLISGHLPCISPGSCEDRLLGRVWFSGSLKNSFLNDVKNGAWDATN